MVHHGVPQHLTLHVAAHISRATHTDQHTRTRASACTPTCLPLQVGLLHVRDVIAGSPMKKGISGGERKRLCVAMELLTRPKLLFLDEPTSGEARAWTCMDLSIQPRPHSQLAC